VAQKFDVLDEEGVVLIHLRTLPLKRTRGKGKVEIVAGGGRRGHEVGSEKTSKGSKGGLNAAGDLKISSSKEEVATSSNRLTPPPRLRAGRWKKKESDDVRATRKEKGKAALLNLDSTQYYQKI